MSLENNSDNLAGTLLSPVNRDTLSDMERDTLSEMNAIAMGAAGSTLSLLLGHEVETTIQSIEEYPQLESMQTPWEELSKSLVIVQYVSGIEATTVFVMKDSDVRRLAGSMLGASEDTGEPLSELEVGAMGELLNQMMNSAATALASLLHETVDINTPQVLTYSKEALLEHFPALASEAFIASNLQITGSPEGPYELIELRLASEVKTHVEKLMNAKPLQATQEVSSSSSRSTSSEEDDSDMETVTSSKSASRSGESSRGYATEPAQVHASGGNTQVNPVMVRPVEFGSFEQQSSVYGEENKNLALVMDVSLSLSVELGKTELSIKDVLELTRGSVIELDRVAGEPVDLMANGKLIAKGEVVVIEDNFGLRITSIVAPVDRLRGLT